MSVRAIAYFIYIVEDVAICLNALYYAKPVLFKAHACDNHSTGAIVA